MLWYVNDGQETEIAICNTNVFTLDLRPVSWYSRGRRKVTKLLRGLEKLSPFFGTLLPRFARQISLLEPLQHNKTT